MKGSELESYMSNFYCTEHYYRVPYGFMITDGVKAFCEKAEAFWVVDLVGSVFLTKHKHFKDNLVAIKLKVKGSEADIMFKGGSKSAFHKQHIPFTDCPEGEWTFFLTDDVMLWSGEY